MGAGAIVLAAVVAGAVLERWPGNDTDKTGPVFPQTLELSRARVLWAFGEHGFEGPGVWVPGGGTTRFMLRTTTPVEELMVRVRSGPDDNTVELRERGQAAFTLEIPGGGPTNHAVRLQNPDRFAGPRGARFLSRFTVHSRGSFVPEGDDSRSLGAFVRVR